MHHVDNIVPGRRHHHESRTLAAAWLVRRYRVRPALAARLAELAGLGGDGR